MPGITGDCNSCNSPGLPKPINLVTLLHYAGYAMSVAYAKAQQFIGAIPYSSLAFIIGLIIGLIKG